MINHIKFGAILLSILLLLFSIKSISQTSYSVDSNEKLTQFVFEELNIARKDPKAYGLKIGIDLGYISPQKPFILSNEISKKCTEYALEMAKNDDLKHDYSNPYGESVGVTTNKKDIFKMFIIDKDTPNLGHRNHLLSNGKAFSRDKYIGIGIVKINLLYWICIRTN